MRTIRLIGILVGTAFLWVLGCGGSTGPATKGEGRIYVQNLYAGASEVTIWVVSVDGEVVQGEHYDLTGRSDPVPVTDVLPGGSKVVLHFHVATFEYSQRAGDFEYEFEVDGNKLIRIKDMYVHEGRLVYEELRYG